MSILETRGPYVFGEWTVTQIVESEVEALQVNVLFPELTAEEIRQSCPQGKASHLSPNGMIIIANQLFVLQKNDVVFVFEMGSGNKKIRPSEPYWTNQNLPYKETFSALGIELEDVTYAAFSHFHNDHVGFATTLVDGLWKPTFPNAQYLAHQLEWDYWNRITSNDSRWHPCIDDSIRPLVDARVLRWVHDGDTIEGVRIHEAPGHTPGSILFEVVHENVWFAGDLFHHPAQIAKPHWPSANFDVDTQLNTAQRRRFFELFAQTNATVFTMHLGEPWTVFRTGPDSYFGKVYPQN